MPNNDNPHDTDLAQAEEQQRELVQCRELLQVAILLVAEYAEMSNDPEAITECAAFIERAAELGGDT